MNTLSNYILERINPRNLGSSDTFPVRGTIDEIVEFLKNSGFTEIKDSIIYDISIRNMKEMMDKVSGRCFIRSRNQRKPWVRFVDSTTPISKNNFIYCIKENRYFIEYYEFCECPLEWSRFSKLIKNKFDFLI